MFVKLTPNVLMSANCTFFPVELNTLNYSLGRSASKTDRPQVLTLHDHIAPALPRMLNLKYFYNSTVLFYDILKQ